MPSPATALRALQELGLAQVAAYARYQVLKRSGWLWRQSRTAIASAVRAAPAAPALGIYPLPASADLSALLSPETLAQIQQTAAEICAGQVRLFDAPPAPLNFTPPVPLSPWPHHESQTSLPHPLEKDQHASPLLPEGRKQGVGLLDIKFLWEPARFSWAVTLARTAHLTGDPEDHFRAAFWAHTERFLAANPPGLGPNWSSAQEVALRLVSLCLAWEVFGPHSTPAQAKLLSEALAAHAARIPPSLDYARAQNNNHRLSEAAGLYSAALFLPSHPMAPAWRRAGWAEFHTGLCSQISPTGEYCQHSANYHRLMLQLALWMQALAAHAGDAFPAESLVRLAAASRWLAALLDEDSGNLPVLGPNDGAYILPLTSAPYRDFRPVLQSAVQVFCGEPLLPPGEWDEMRLWFFPSAPTQAAAIQPSLPMRNGVGFPHTLRAPQSWGYLRAARFRGRPGHADQLHFDLWWRGLNLALDAGTYLYNAPPPWDNRLTSAHMHNTLTLDDQDQMQRAGRFLYLSPAQAEITEDLRSPQVPVQRLTARHHGYARLGVLHVRSVSAASSETTDEWLVEDQVVAARGRKAARVRLHWLLPDLPWALETTPEGWALALETPHGPVRLLLQSSLPGSLLLTRAGVRLAGEGDVQPTWGWWSPNYGQLHPALSLAVTVEGPLPIALTTRWMLPASD